MVVALVVAGAVTQRAGDELPPDIGAGRSLPPTSGPSKTLPHNDTRGTAGTLAGSPPLAFDNRGFLSSSARCSDAQSAFVIGRTQRSLVVICGGAPGHYVYVGLRLSDAAVLRSDAKPDSTHGFVAQRAEVRYIVSPAELRVTSGATVIKQEPMLEYRVLAR